MCVTFMCSLCGTFMNRGEHRLRFPECVCVSVCLIPLLLFQSAGQPLIHNFVRVCVCVCFVCACLCCIVRTHVKGQRSVMFPQTAADTNSAHVFIVVTELFSVLSECDLNMMNLLWLLFISQ